MNNLSLRLIIFHLKCFKIIFLITENISPYNAICLSFLALRVSLHARTAHAWLPATEPFTYASEFQMVSGYSLRPHYVYPGVFSD